MEGGTLSFWARARTELLSRFLKAYLPEKPAGTFEPRRILISAKMGIGNMLMFLPFLRALRKQFPHARIVTVGLGPNGSEKLLEVEKGLVDEHVLLNPDKAPRRRVLLRAWKLGRAGWDTAIFRYHGLFGEMILATIAARPQWRVGHVTSAAWKNRWDAIINVPVAMEAGTHEVTRYMKLLKPFGGSEAEVDFHFPADDRDDAEAAKLLQACGLEDQDFIAIHPGSSEAQKWKRWPESRWIEFVSMATEAGFTVAAMGSTGEKDLCERICGKNPRVFSLAGRSGLRATARVLKRARVLIGSDSNLVHFAAAVGTPVVGLWGPGDECKGRPLGRSEIIRASICRGPCYTLENNYIFPKRCDPIRCMAAIEPADLLAAINRLLNAPAQIAVGPN